VDIFPKFEDEKLPEKFENLNKKFYAEIEFCKIDPLTPSVLPLTFSL
jgi:hypothetical protein